MRWMHAAGRGLLVLAVLLAGYAGFGNRAGPAGDGRGPMTLVTAGDLTEYLGPLLDDWNSGHPQEQVTLVELPDSADETRAQMTSELRSGSDRFDVLNIDVAWTSEFAAAGWISPLERDRFPLDSFLAPVVDTATFDSRLYAVPYVTNAGLLYYRKDILEKAGERPPRTWAELARQARTLAPRYGLDGYAGQFLPYEGLTVNATEAVHSAGGSILRDDGARVTVDSAAARDGLEFLASGVREGWISPRPVTTRRRSPGRPSRTAGCSSCGTGRMSTRRPTPPGRRSRGSSARCLCRVRTVPVPVCSAAPIWP